MILFMATKPESSGRETVTHTYVDLLQSSLECVLHHVYQGQCSLYC